MKSIVMVVIHVSGSNQISTVLETGRFVTKKALEINLLFYKYNAPYLSLGLLK